MKFEDIYLSLLAEQDDDEDQGVHGFDDGQLEPVPEEPADPEDEFVRRQGGEVYGEPDKPQQKEKKPKIKPLTEFDKVKIKWQQENPALTDDDAEGTIDFFNRRKNGLRVYKDPDTNPDYINLPEITSLLVRFPDMAPILTDISKLRDIQNYRWEQMEFFMDVAGTADTTPLMDFHIEGDTPEIRKENALKKWDTDNNRILHENGITVFRITGKDEAIGLGRYQRLLVSQYGGANWCITNADSPGSTEGRNLYSSYRSYSVYYFVLNTKMVGSNGQLVDRKENDRYYVSAVNACDMNSHSGRNSGPYFITPRPNGSETNKSWSDIVRIHPQLNGKEHLFKYFPLTSKERASAELDKINFKHDDPFYFGSQSFATKKQYIEDGRLINDKLAFRTLLYSKENNLNLRKLYIDNTNLDNYKNKFKCSDSTDPFGILNVIYKETPQLYKYLDEYQLKSVLKIKKGIWAVKVSIIGSSYWPIGIDKNTNFVLYQDKNRIHCGIMDVERVEWIKEMKYAPTKPIALRKGSERFMLKRYASMDGDYFYFLTNMQTYNNKQSSDYGVGQYFNKDDGNNLLSSGEYREFQKVIK